MKSLLDRQADRVRAWCPALKGCDAFGANRREAIRNITAAIQEWFVSNNELKHRIPECYPVTITYE